jgi:hypothetical protein
MAEDSFDDFDSDVNFNDAVGPQEEEQQPEPQQQAQRPAQAPQRPRAPQRRQAPVTPQMAAATATAPQAQPAPKKAEARYIPYEMPKKIGVLDRVTGQPIIEDEDMLRVVMAQLADIKNDLEEIKSYY